MAHKFSVGQIVDRDRDRLGREVAEGPFEVARHLPYEDAHDEPSYKIRNLRDQHERVVQESSLTLALTPQPEA